MTSLLVPVNEGLARAEAATKERDAIEETGNFMIAISSRPSGQMCGVKGNGVFVSNGTRFE